MIDNEEYRTQFLGEIVRFADTTGIIDELRKERSMETFVQALHELTHIRFCLPKPEPPKDVLIRERLTMYLDACRSHIMGRFSVDLLVGFEAKARQACADRPRSARDERFGYAAEKRKGKYAEKVEDSEKKR